MPFISETTTGALRPRRSLGRRIAVAGAALLGAAAFAAPAEANLSVAGPPDPVTGFPAWYQDSTGMQLELCLTGANCPASPPSGTTAPTPPNDEAFYSMADAELLGPNGEEFALSMHLEAAYLDPVTDGQITFGRIQLTIDGGTPDAEYTVHHPYGTDTWTAGGDGKLLGGNASVQRIQVGCDVTPCDFDAAKGTQIGPFLTWDPAQLPAAPAGFIGDGATPHAVVGSTFNAVTITGGDLPPQGVTTDQFVIQGKLASAPAPLFSVAPGSGDFGTRTVGSTTARTITVRNNGLAPMPAITGVSITGADASSFASTANTCAGATLASGASCTVSVSFTPATAGAKAASLVLAKAGGSDTVALQGTGAAVAPIVTTPIVAATTIIQQAAAPATTEAPAPAVAASVRPKLLGGLKTTRSMRLRRAKKEGIAANVVMLGKGDVETRVYAVLADGGYKLLASKRGSRSNPGTAVVKLRSARFRKALRAGLYAVVALPIVDGQVDVPSGVTTTIRLKKKPPAASDDSSLIPRPATWRASVVPGPSSASDLPDSVPRLTPPPQLA